ncbi:MAG: copper homeostasis protein CutC [Sarcina sp.]
MIYEACVGSFREALEAEKRGASRVELCDNLKDDGTTASFGTIKKTVEKLAIPVMVIIRPRGGNFNYTEDEVEIMIEDIKIVKELKAHGVVIGALKNQELDLKVVKRLVNEAKGLDITFHMAFDEIKDKYKALEQLIELGVNRVLSKGGNINAIDGKEQLKKLNEFANGRIIIMPGKSVTKENRDFLLQYIGTTEIHGTKIV